MAFALVGSAGVASQGAVGVAVTPAWDAGASRTAGNLLLCFVSVTGSISAPTSITGWSRVSNGNNSCAGALFYKVAAGGDAAPTIPAVTSAVLSVHLEEWSGNDTSAPIDTTTFGNGFGTASPVTATGGTVPTAANQLVAIIGADFRSAARAPNDTWTSNHGTPVLRASNNGVSVAHHYSHATLISNSAAAADTATMTASVTTSITGLTVVIQSFKLAAAGGPVTGTGDGTQTTATSTGAAAEQMTATGAGVGTAPSASGSGSVGAAFGTGAGTQTVQTATGSGLETITGSGAGTQVVQTAAGTAAETITGSGAATGTAGSATGTAAETITGSGVGTQTVQTASGAGLFTPNAITGTGTGTQAVAAGAGSGVSVEPGAIAGTGAGVQVPASGAGTGTVEEVTGVVSGGGDVRTFYIPRGRVTGTGGGAQVAATARGKATVNDDELVLEALAA